MFLSLLTSVSSSIDSIPTSAYGFGLGTFFLNVPRLEPVISLAYMLENVRHALINVQRETSSCYLTNQTWPVTVNISSPFLSRLSAHVRGGQVPLGRSFRNCVPKGGCTRVFHLKSRHATKLQTRGLYTTVQYWTLHVLVGEVETD